MKPRKAGCTATPKQLKQLEAIAAALEKAEAPPVEKPKRRVGITRAQAFQLTGTESLTAVSFVISGTAAVQSEGSWDDPQSAAEAAVEMLLALQPQGALETLLCAQMLNTHAAAQQFLMRSLTSTAPEIADSQTRRAARLMQLFVQQAEMLQKLRGKSGQQSVKVEHIHVNEGGRALIGPVTSGSAVQMTSAIAESAVTGLLGGGA